MQTEFFKDLIVLELAGVLAGPAAGMFFAELGARVIKIENKRTDGDAIRRWKLPSDNPALNTSSYYHSVNWKKEVLFLDFSMEADREKVNEYLDRADIVLTNFRKSDALKLKFDPESLKLKYPALIIAEISGFSEDERVAYDAVLQAESGFMSMNGTPESGPLKMPVALIDVLAAHHLKEGILIALIHRLRTGKGSHVNVSLEEAAIASLANQAAGYLNTGEVPGLAGSLHPVIAPYGEVFTTSDQQKIVLAVGTDAQFSKLCALLSCDQIAIDPQYAANFSRVKNRKSLFTELQSAISHFPGKSLMEQLNKQGIPAGLIRDMKEVFNTPHARAMVLEQEEENGMISKRVRTTAFKISFTV
jgi:crotonobetainyl-CoA:carnitine CoA-transferase CaiB-like acyl-CoA transferase